jgi:hypothetical protein
MMSSKVEKLIQPYRIGEQIIPLTQVKEVYDIRARRQDEARQIELGELASQGHPIDPIIVEEVIEDKQLWYINLEGRTRVSGCKRRGILTIAAIILKNVPEDVRVEISVAGNSGMATPNVEADIAKAAFLLFKQGKKEQEIKKRLGAYWAMDSASNPVHTAAKDWREANKREGERCYHALITKGKSHPEAIKTACAQFKVTPQQLVILVKNKKNNKDKNGKKVLGSLCQHLGRKVVDDVNAAAQVAEKMCRDRIVGSAEVNAFYTRVVKDLQDAKVRVEETYERFRNSTLGDSEL